MYMYMHVAPPITVGTWSVVYTSTCIHCVHAHPLHIFPIVFYYMQNVKYQNISHHISLDQWLFFDITIHMHTHYCMQLWNQNGCGQLHVHCKTQVWNMESHFTRTLYFYSPFIYTTGHVTVRVKYGESFSLVCCICTRLRLVNIHTHYS